ncbi:MAG: response regulator [Anaerolineae bacterium]|nr:response regulator [Anaerolineae bacterium]MCO5187639.1 response regulator [Anaerolineae bacterium]MCO5194301.1 response regulator [Anaerolineae bacterium]MCO5197347.1 response regulator [Anaerolineae bacterium]MCO5205021.1 response regulator [Anaerolineae bacterium]
MNTEMMKILLIEDNLLQAQIIEKLLDLSRQVKFSVEVVTTAADGLRRLANESYALVLTDLYLPDSYGVDTLERVQAQAPDTPVVVLTNIDEEVVAVKSAEKGAQDYLVKSRLTSPILVRSIRFAVARHAIALETRRHYEARITQLESRLSRHS